MKLTVRSYSWLLGIQFTLLVADIILNTFGSWFSYRRLPYAIFLFVTQDVLIVAVYGLFTLSMQATCAYKVGASHLILQNCKLFIVSVLLYFVLTVSQHFWIIHQFGLPNTELTKWPMALFVLMVLQKFVSVFYYYCSKRTALTMADPRFGEEHLDWIAEQLGDK